MHAVRLMLQRRISGLPVIDGAGKLVGMVTEGDFLRRKETETIRRRPSLIAFFVGPGQLADEYTHAAGRFVKDVMTHDVLTVNESASLAEIVTLMERNHVKRFPVMRGQQVVGIVTRKNLMHALIGQSQETKLVSTDDETIRTKLLAELKQHSWTPATIDVVVSGGAVRLIGTIFDDRQRAAVRVATENTPGVKKIEDQLVCIEPMSGTVIPATAA
jgi:CBS domain-containing protein